MTWTSLENASWYRTLKQFCGFIGVAIRLITPFMLLEIVWTVLLRDDESPTSGNKAQGVLIQNSVPFSGLKTDSLLMKIIRSFNFSTNGHW